MFISFLELAESMMLKLSSMLKEISLRNAEQNIIGVARYAYAHFKFWYLCIHPSAKSNLYILLYRFSNSLVNFQQANVIVI